MTVRVAAPGNHLCYVLDCQRLAHIRGVCGRHYKRLWLYGDPCGKPVPIKRATLAERFWKYVEKTDLCWLWIGFIGHGGYGRFNVDNRVRNAHRVAYELMVGPIPSGLELDHLCRVRRCVRPDHLEPVTQRENNRRSDSISSRYARRTHCGRGHPLSGDNLRIISAGSRRCRACEALWDHVWRMRVSNQDTAT